MTKSRQVLIEELASLYMMNSIKEGKMSKGLLYTLTGFKRECFKLGMLVAHDENKGIGYRNKLPWHVPSDLKVFKRLTTGNVVIMGRKTYESLPMFPNGLPDRFNIVISSTGGKSEDPDVVFVKNKRQAISLAKRNGLLAYVIGGASIYKLFVDDVDFLICTHIQGSYETDTKMIDIDQFTKEKIYSYNDPSIPIEHHLYKHNKSSFSFLDR